MSDPRAWEKQALEVYFQRIRHYKDDQINTSKVRCGLSKVVPGQFGVFARVNIQKGDIVEWGLATVIPAMDVRTNDRFYTWDCIGKTKAAALSGCALYYNTLGDKSNARCVPYHQENRFEIYALRDIAEGEELTIRYDSMNYRVGMKAVRDIVGELKEGDRLAS